MAYNYYCTYCGRELDQDKVFFDMRPVFTDREFNVLKFLITKKELEAMVASGTKLDEGYVCCKLTLQGLMSYISNANNLNDPAIAALTLEDIKGYITDIMIEETTAEVEQSDNLFEIDEPEKPKEVKAVQEEQEVTKVSDAIRALEQKHTKNEDKYFTKDRLKADLETLYTAFSLNAEYSFDLCLNTEQDNEGKPVLIGYTVNAGSITIVNQRICKHCGAPVFEHAGTAEHRSIAFIGDQKSGKTSTILALVHYAKNAVAGVMEGDEIWKEACGIDSISNIELLSPSDRLLADIDDYGNGIAPGKTRADVRSDAYSATLRIKNKYQDRHYLLTLTDLPGELCDPQTGKIDRNNILNNFPVALACDAFVLCFDSETAKGGNANRMIQNACSWANGFQQSRVEHNVRTGKDKGLSALIPKGKGATGLYAPVMMIFTKCREVEQPEAVVQKLPAMNAFDFVARTYVFDEERSWIDNNRVYNRVGELMSQYDCLTNAYHSRLRCSPYGFAAPNADQVKENPDLQYDENSNKLYPKPKHIDLLLRWLLEASGCIPVGAEYRPSPDPMSKTVYKPHPNFVCHTQYRALAPRGTGKDADVHEALARCYLFENPGYFDQQFLMYYAQKAILTARRWESRIKRNWE